MKKIKIFTMILWFSMLLSTINLASAQAFSKLDKDQHDITYFKVGRELKPSIRVVYGRPSTKNPQVFGHEIPYGEVWRTGANEATEIKFYRDLMFGHKYVKAGTYTLYSIPEKEYWTIILNSETDRLGAFFTMKARM